MEAGDQVQSHFGLGGFSTAAAQLLAPLAATLRSTRPSLEVQVLEANPARCFDLLVAERIDLAVAEHEVVGALEAPAFRKYQQINEEMFRPLAEKLGPEVRALIEAARRAEETRARFGAT